MLRSATVVPWCEARLAQARRSGWHLPHLPCTSRCLSTPFTLWCTRGASAAAWTCNSPSQSVCPPCREAASSKCLASRAESCPEHQTLLQALRLPLGPS